ncbi:pyrimidine 5 -nucleotidase [Tubulinosema ratisbonensis]|uniref:Pyrimidine 5-nucleotidase n=1 Tax=Tubulinosema ratisbonensis TaxID=291195 RepID=A0A437AKE7_9MICR|nr:pyrimidine 5 -nucleotidase [Tubulinosema ratisbonensis]
MHNLNQLQNSLKNSEVIFVLQSSEKNLPQFIPLKNDTNSFSPPNKEKIYIFDINETLYFGDTNTKTLRRAMIVNYLTKLGYEEKESFQKLEYFSCKYGCIFKGLREELNIKESQLQLLESSSDDLKSVIKEDKELKNLLLKLKGRKACLTNGRPNQAKECLMNINVLDCFEYVFHWDDSSTDYIIKPNKEAYLFVQNYFNATADQITFFDNTNLHVNGAKSVGWNGYLVSEEDDIKKILKRMIENQ